MCESKLVKPQFKFYFKPIRKNSTAQDGFKKEKKLSESSCEA